MNRDDIIRMARAAGCHDNGEEFRFVELRYLERFAALVAAAERVRMCEQFGLSKELAHESAKDNEAD